MCARCFSAVRDISTDGLRSPPRSPAFLGWLSFAIDSRASPRSPSFFHVFRTISRPKPTACTRSRETDANTRWASSFHSVPGRRETVHTPLFAGAFSGRPATSTSARLVVRLGTSDSAHIPSCSRGFDFVNVQNRSTPSHNSPSHSGFMKSTFQRTVAVCRVRPLSRVFVATRIPLQNLVIIIICGRVSDQY